MGWGSCHLGGLWLGLGKAPQKVRSTGESGSWLGGPQTAKVRVGVGGALAVGARTLLEFLFPWHQPRSWHTAGILEMLNAQISPAGHGHGNDTCLGFLSVMSVSVIGISL